MWPTGGRVKTFPIPAWLCPRAPVTRFISLLSPWITLEHAPFQRITLFKFKSGLFRAQNPHTKSQSLIWQTNSSNHLKTSVIIWARDETEAESVPWRWKAPHHLISQASIKIGSLWSFFANLLCLSRILMPQGQREAEDRGRAFTCLFFLCSNNSYFWKCVLLRKRDPFQRSQNGAFTLP